MLGYGPVSPRDLHTNLSSSVFFFVSPLGYPVASCSCPYSVYFPMFFSIIQVISQFEEMKAGCIPTAPLFTHILLKMHFQWDGLETVALNFSHTLFRSSYFVFLAYTFYTHILHIFYTPTFFVVGMVAFHIGLHKIAQDISLSFFLCIHSVSHSSYRPYIHSLYLIRKSVA